MVELFHIPKHTRNLTSTPSEKRAKVDLVWHLWNFCTPIRASSQRHREEMRSQLPDNVLINLLKQCYLSPSCQASPRLLRVRPRRNERTFVTSTKRHSRLENTKSQDSRKCVPTLESELYADSSVFAKPSHSPTGPKIADGQRPPPNIAVLGGGITGLSSAYYLSQHLPAANITLYESTDRLGGWLRSKHINVGTGTVVFEQGPRTLRPHTSAGLVTLELVVICLAKLYQLVLTDAYRPRNSALKKRCLSRPRTPLQPKIDSFTIQIILCRCPDQVRDS